jgi:DNA mismatch endonuclease (patch repair protein)
MRAIKSKDTTLERKFRSVLTKAGFKYKKNVAKLAGKPDIVFYDQRVVVFLDSCFWHGCKKHLRMPKQNRSYWEKKIERNKNRDGKIGKYYKRSGWNIVRIWEHNLSDIKKIEGAVRSVVKKLKYNR